MLDWASEVDGLSSVLGACAWGDGIVGVSLAARKMPWVASVACWRKTVGEWLSAALAGLLVVVVVAVAVDDCAC